jgi:hypothetical protein
LSADGDIVRIATERADVLPDQLQREDFIEVAIRWPQRSTVRSY